MSANVFQKQNLFCEWRLSLVVDVTVNVLVVLGHPEAGSFNNALASTTVSTMKHLGHKVVFHDLYAEKFDPVLKFEEIPSD